MQRNREFADLLLRKGAQDEYAFVTMRESAESPIEIIGFHAQQAVAKYIKAVLAFRNGVPLRSALDGSRCAP